VEIAHGNEDEEIDEYEWTRNEKETQSSAAVDEN
jgi:hypothetical protein